jgi:hypothetical protein
VRAALVVAAVVAWGGVAITPASAQRAADEAQREFRLGYEALQAGDCPEALVHYRRSLELSPRPRTLFNMAACEEELGLAADAWRNYHAFLDLAEARDAKIVIKAEARIAALRRTLRGKLAVDSSPAGASVIVDGEPEVRGVTPLTLALEPGAHTIRLTMAGASPVERTIEIIPDQAETLAVDLAVSSSDAGTESPGEPEVETVHPRTLPPMATLVVGTVPPGEKGSVDLRARTPGRRSLAWGLGGLGVGAILGGAVVGVLALRDVASPFGGEHDRGKDRALLADGLFAVGAVAVVVAWRYVRAGGSP